MTVEKNKGGRPPNENKEQLKEILLQNLIKHIKENNIPHISTFITENMDLALEHGYKALEQFLYDNNEFSSLLKVGKHKRVSNLLNGILYEKLNVTGGIFALKQDGFSDKQEIIADVSTENKDLKNLSSNELMKIIRDRAKDK